MTTLKEAFIAKYPKNAILAEKWRIATNTPFAWESLTKPNMSVFVKWLCDNMAQAFARQYCAKLRAVIEPYAEEYQMPKDWRKFLTVYDEPQRIKHLEEVIEGIVKSYEKKLKKKTEMLVERQEKLRYYRNKYNRFLARMTFLQEQHPEIDFGLDDFKQKYFAQRDAEQGEEQPEQDES